MSRDGCRIWYDWLHPTSVLCLTIIIIWYHIFMAIAMSIGDRSNRNLANGVFFESPCSEVSVDLKLQNDVSSPAVKFHGQKFYFHWKQYLKYLNTCGIQTHFKYLECFLVFAFKYFLNFSIWIVFKYFFLLILNDWNFWKTPYSANRRHNYHACSVCTSVSSACGITALPKFNQVIFSWKIDNLILYTTQ